MYGVACSVVVIYNLDNYGHINDKNARSLMTSPGIPKTLHGNKDNEDKEAADAFTRKRLPVNLWQPNENKRRIMKEFNGKAAVITGAGRGIGRGITLRCAKEGMKGGGI